MSYGSDKKLAWKCILGHVYQSSVSSRVRGSGCPYCAGNAVLAGFNDLRSRFPEVAKQAFDWDPSTVTAFSNKKLSWACSNGHQWSASVASRTKLASGCPFCAGQRPIIGETDLFTTHPKLSKEAFGWDPTTVTHGSGVKKLWVCETGHHFIAAVKDRVSGTGCPYCAGKKVLIGFNDLETLRPDLASEAEGWDPATVTLGSNKKMQWRCPLGHQWVAPVHNRTIGKGCPTCGGRNVLPGFNDFASQNPLISHQADGWDPTKIHCGANRALPWRCDSGHSWLAPPARRSNGVGCPYCTNQVVIIGVSDLKTRYPQIAAEAFGWEPSKVHSGSHEKRTWRCGAGHQWTATVSGRTFKLSGCPYCSGREVIEGENDLRSLFPRIAEEAYGWDPGKISAHSGARREWRCVNGHNWQTRVAQRTGGSKSGCPSCAKTGFNPSKDGWLYFLRHDLWGLLQIGISNTPEDRVTRHMRSGWTVIEIRGPMPGDITYGWEQDILESLREIGVALGPEFIAGKFSGYTEAWIEEEYPATSIDGLMKLVRDWEESNRGEFPTT